MPMAEFDIGIDQKDGHDVGVSCSALLVKNRSRLKYLPSAQTAKESGVKNTGVKNTTAPFAAKPGSIDPFISRIIVGIANIAPMRENRQNTVVEFGTTRLPSDVFLVLNSQKVPARARSTRQYWRRISI